MFPLSHLSHVPLSLCFFVLLSFCPIVPLSSCPVVLLPVLPNLCVCSINLHPTDPCSHCPICPLTLCPFVFLALCPIVLLTTISVIIDLMKEDKVRIRTYLPRKVYVELHKRHMYEHLPFLLAFLLEEFLKTDVSISWEEMPTKAEQREYLERKLREFLSRNGLSTEFPKPSVQGKAEPARVQGEPSPPIYVQGTPKEGFTPSKPEPVKEEKTPSSEGTLDDILKRIESLW
jgi:hypothetical protein